MAGPAKSSAMMRSHQVHQVHLRIRWNFYAGYRYVPANQRRGAKSALGWIPITDDSNLNLTERATSMTCPRRRSSRHVGNQLPAATDGPITAVVVASMNVTLPLSPPRPPRCNLSSWGIEAYANAIMPDL